MASPLFNGLFSPEAPPPADVLLNRILPEDNRSDVAAFRLVSQRFRTLSDTPVAEAVIGATGDASWPHALSLLQRMINLRSLVITRTPDPVYLDDIDEAVLGRLTSLVTQPDADVVIRPMALRLFYGGLGRIRHLDIVGATEGQVHTEHHLAPLAPTLQTLSFATSWDAPSNYACLSVLTNLNKLTLVNHFDAAASWRFLASGAMSRLTCLEIDVLAVPAGLATALPALTKLRANVLWHWGRLAACTALTSLVSTASCPEADALPPPRLAFLQVRCGETDDVDEEDQDPVEEGVDLPASFVSGPSLTALHFSDREPYPLSAALAATRDLRQLRANIPSPTGLQHIASLSRLTQLNLAVDSSADDGIVLRASATWAPLSRLVALHNLVVLVDKEAHPCILRTVRELPLLSWVVVASSPNSKSTLFKGADWEAMRAMLRAGEQMSPAALEAAAGLLV